MLWFITKKHEVDSLNKYFIFNLKQRSESHFSIEIVFLVFFFAISGRAVSFPSGK